MNNKIKVLIIEDEKIFADNLEHLLLEIEDSIEVLAKIGTVKKSIEWFQKHSANLVFMDIHLADGLSFEIFEQLEIETPVIFITSFDQYAIQAFKVNSIDYLLKPIKIEDLRNAIEKYKKTSMPPIKPDYEQLLAMMMNKTREYKKRFMVNIADKIKTIHVEDIAYFSVWDGNTFITTKSGNVYGLNLPLEKIENMLDLEYFFRINRRYIIHIKSIKNMYTLSKSKIKLELVPAPEEDTIVSLSKTSEFRKWLNK